MPLSPGLALQRVPTPEALDLKRRSLELYTDCMVRPEFRAEMDRIGFRERRNAVMRTDGRRGAEILASELLEFIAAGATHAEVEMLIAWVRGIADDAFDVRDGKRLPAIIEAEIAEHEADVAEDSTQLPIIQILASGKHLTTAELRDRLERMRRQTARGSIVVRVYENELRRRDLGLYERSA